MLKADSLSVAAPALVGAVTHADPKQTLAFQIIALVLPFVPRIISAIQSRRQARKAQKNAN